MAQTYKLSEEEFKQVTELNESYGRVYSEIGQITVQIDRFEKALAKAKEEREHLLKDQASLMEREDVLMEELTAKYGNGQLDLETGVITAT